MTFSASPHRRLFCETLSRRPRLFGLRDLITAAMRKAARPVAVFSHYLGPLAHSRRPRFNYCLIQYFVYELSSFAEEP